MGNEARMVLAHLMEQWTPLVDSMRANATKATARFRELADALADPPGGEDR